MNKTLDKIERLVLDAEDKVVRDFLIELLKRDRELAQRFTRRISSKITENDVRQLERRIDKVIHRHAGYENYLEYDQIEKFVADLMMLITEEIGPLVKKKANLAAFKLVNYIILEVRKVDIDDSEGELFEVSSECQYIWEDILKNATTQEKENMYLWFKIQLDQYKYYFGYSEIEVICERYF